jgi:signal transduction histidine kinase/GAF domain-containing protein
MSFLESLFDLITTSPGDLVYHLVTVFAIQITLGIALGHWDRNRRDPTGIRLFTLGVGLTLARASLMVVAVLVRIDVVLPGVIMPPLERFLDLATLLLAAWALLPIPTRYFRLSTMSLVVSLVIAGGIYLAFAILWSPAETQSISYNDYWQGDVWEFLSALIPAAALLATLIWHEDEWDVSMFLFALWALGHILQLAIPAPPDSNTAGWVRLSNLPALPLLAGAVYRRALKEPAEDGVDTSLEMANLLGAVQRIEAAQDVEATLSSVISSLARALKADMIAVGVPVVGSADPQADPKTHNSSNSKAAKRLRIVALHPPTDVMLAQEPPTLLISRHPLMATAIETNNIQRSNGPGRDPAIASLYRRLGFEQPGPLVALPLTGQKGLLGVLLAGNPVSQRDWTARNEQILQAMGAAIATAWVSATSQDTKADGELLRKAINEARRLAQRASALKAELEQEHQRAEELNTKLRLREQEQATEDKAKIEATLWQEEVHKLTQARDTLQSELTEWREKAEQFALSKNMLLRQLAQAQSQLKSALSQEPQSPSQEQAPRRGVGPRGILISDEEGTVILASQGARHLLGQARPALEGTSLQDLFSEPSWVGAVNRLLSQEPEDSDTAKATLNLEGRMIRAELTRIPKIAGGVGTLAVMLQPAEAASQTAQNEAITSLIHEVRTPMTSITSYTDLLLGEAVGILGESQRQFLHRINANIERLRGLLEDLAKVASVEASQFSLSPEPVDLIGVIEDAIMSMSTQFSEGDIGVHLDLPSELPPIHADRDSLYQIVLRLLSNACQVSKSGTQVNVHARVEEYDTPMDRVPSYLFMSVTDTGGGIAPEDQRRLFQRLYRADNPTIAGVGDTGVGLSIAKALVETQGGRIWVESEPGVGSSFSFILPLSFEDEEDLVSSLSIPDPFAGIIESAEEDQ